MNRYLWRVYNLRLPVWEQYDPGKGSYIMSQGWKQADKNSPGSQSCKPFLKWLFVFWVYSATPCTGVCRFFFQLNLLPFYLLCLQWDHLQKHSFFQVNFFALKQHLPYQGDLHIFSMYTHTHKSHKTYYLSLKTHTHTHNTHTHIKTYFCFHIFSHVYIVSKLLSKGTILKKWKQ